MKILMAGINFNNNSISQREKLSFTAVQAGDICERVCKKVGICGCVVLSTCNRTEIYLSCDENTDFKADEILLECSGVNNFDGKFEKNSDIDAVYYLITLACGLKSQIVGEGQIVTQINGALEISRERKCTESVIDTLFRTAVSAGKYALTNVRITNVPMSSAYGAVDLLERIFGDLYGRTVVLIGNGKIGHIMQSLLINKGCDVFVTLRSYKSGNNEVVNGCRTISYAERYKYIDGCDFVVSATRSPHFTVTREKMEQVKVMPRVMIDLALPRDIEPNIKGLCKCFNIDELGYKTEIDKKSLDEAYAVIDKFAADFIQWENYKFSIPYISEIKDIVAQRIMKSGQAENVSLDGESVKTAVDRTVDILLGSMKNNVFPHIMKECTEKIKERARL